MNVILSQGGKVAIVSSGAVALGKMKTGFRPEADVPESELARLAAIGQPWLMTEVWARAFAKYGRMVGQILLVDDDIEAHPENPHDRRFRGEARESFLHTVHRHWEHDDVVIINANDPMAERGELAQLSNVADNDRLSCTVATELGSDRFAMITDRPGVLKTPDKPDSDRYPEIHVSTILHGDRSKFVRHDPNKAVRSRGGMDSKLEQAALFAKATGNAAFISDGFDDCLVEYFRNGSGHPIERGTLIIP